MRSRETEQLRDWERERDRARGQAEMKRKS